jgi:hypothetical protein
MSGATPPLTQYAFMAWCSVKGTTLTFQVYLTSILLLMKDDKFKYRFNGKRNEVLQMKLLLYLK